MRLLTNETRHGKCEFCMGSGEKNSKGNVMAKWKEGKANFKGGYKADTAEVEFNYVKVKPVAKKIPRMNEFYLTTKRY